MKNILVISLMLVLACKSTNQKQHSFPKQIIGNWQMLDDWCCMVEKDGQVWKWKDTVMVDTIDYLTTFDKYYFLNDSDLVATSFDLHNDSNIFRSPCVYHINTDTLNTKCYNEGNKASIYHNSYIFSIKNNILILLSLDFDELSIWMKFRKDQIFSKQDFHRIRDSLNQHFSVLDFVLKTGKQKGKKLYYKRE